MSRKRIPMVQRPGEEQPEVLLRPPEKKRLEQFKEFFWDRKNKTCCTRTPLNWCTITIYYIAFLSVTFGIMFLTLFIVRIMAEQNPNAPRYSGNSSLLGWNPGVNFFPALYSESPMIAVSGSYEKIIGEIDKNLESCLKDVNCLKEMKKCGAAPYGYDGRSPCIYLRINRLIGWKPLPFESDSLPDNFPQELKPAVSDSKTGKIWVRCQGTHPKDRDKFSQDDFFFETSPGFDLEGFPYEKTKPYLDPIVVFRLKNNGATGVLYSISCTFWGKNIYRTLEILFFLE